MSASPSLKGLKLQPPYGCPLENPGTSPIDLDLHWVWLQRQG